MALQEEFESQGNWLFKYRGVLPLVILFFGLGVYVYAQIHPEYWTLHDRNQIFYYEMVCLAVSLFGEVVRIFTVGFTPAGTSGRNTKQQVAESINTSGIYSTIRHPLYVGNFFSWLGFAMLTANVWFIVAFTLLYWLYYERIMFAEEQFLRKKYGPPYLTWASQTPAILPKFSQYKKPIYPFSWRKVVRNEKTGITGIFVVFVIFNVTGELVKGTRDFNYPLIIVLAVCVVLYAVIKILTKNTKVLDEQGR
jgi:protein-S-isoprenylcysteine O-methyltransferase Ste14